MARKHRGRGLLLLASQRPGGRVLASPNTNPRQPLSAAAALGRAGKPQFITKMENDTSPRSSPGGADLWPHRGRGHSSAPLGAHAVCGGINSRVISHQRERCPADRLFAVIYYKGAPARQHGMRRRELAGACARPLPSLPPVPHPKVPPRHWPLFASHPLGETRG